MLKKTSPFSFNIPPRKGLTCAQVDIYYFGRNYAFCLQRGGEATRKIPGVSALGSGDTTATSAAAGSQS
jgi:hypothetical protein